MPAPGYEYQRAPMYAPTEHHQRKTPGVPGVLGKAELNYFPDLRFFSSSLHFSVQLSKAVASFSTLQLSTQAFRASDITDFCAMPEKDDPNNKMPLRRPTDSLTRLVISATPRNLLWDAVLGIKIWFHIQAWELTEAQHTTSFSF